MQNVYCISGALILFYQWANVHSLKEEGWNHIYLLNVSLSGTWNVMENLETFIKQWRRKYRKFLLHKIVFLMLFSIKTKRVFT